MAKSNRLLALLFLASGALALPLSAEEITVTVPPDQVLDPNAAPPQPPSLPPAQPVPPVAGKETTKTPVAQDTTSPTGDQAPQQEAAPPPPPAAPAAAPAPSPASEAPPAASTAVEKTTAPAKAHSAKKHTATAKKAVPAAKPSAASAEKPAATKETAAAKHTAKKKKKTASCKGLDENKCGANSACIWVVGTVADATNKATKPRCRSLAVLKRETAKARKAHKSDKPEVLPWAKPTTTGSTSAAAAQPASKPKPGN
ncbi:hypothetical protein [Hyphomicrobium sp.]|uniref:hypothetical protein n=1 Tax=Hyphomicrobium sp. TaxID=82 RepID=UPI002C21E32E|nr:hypothetical protein [Hyphomicrobium sp.]HVZ05542.1 hypothetical protein [Hyphomicrobium sp.]